MKTNPQICEAGRLHMARWTVALAAVLLVSCHTPYVLESGPPLIAHPILSIPGYVYSPYINRPRLIDVRDFEPGMILVCPYTGRAFIMPDASFQLPLPTATPVPERRVSWVRWTPRSSVITGSASATIPSTPVPAAALLEQKVPYGTSIPGRPGFVTSPFAEKHQIVDVQGLSPGMPVRCPFTGKLFRVPPPK